MFKHFSGKVGLNNAGLDHIGGYAPRADFFCEVPRENFNRAFHCSVSGVTGAGESRQAAQKIDDAPAVGKNRQTFLR